MHTTLGTAARSEFSGPPLSPTNQPDATTLPDNLRRIVNNLPVECTVNGLMSYLKTRVTHPHDLYLVLRHLDDPDLESGLLAQSRTLRVYLGISKDRWFAQHSSQPKIAPERTAEALAWAVTRLSDKYQHRALAILEVELPSVSIIVRSKVLEALNQDFDQLSEASRLQIVDKLMTPSMLRDLPDTVLLPLQQRLKGLRHVVAPARGQQIEQVSHAITRTMYQNLAANLPSTLPEPITFCTDRTGPHLLRNIATSIRYANKPAQQIAALDLLTPCRLAALPTVDREKVRGTLRILQSSQGESRSAVCATSLEVTYRIDQLLQLMAEQDTFLIPLRTWQQQPTIPPSADGKQTAVSRIIDCWQSGAPNLNLSRLGLSTLPSLLPPHVKGLNVNDNALTSLPALTVGLTHLIATNNQLGSLPTLPDGLQKLFVFANQLEQLPPLSAGLTELRISKNPLLTNVRIAELSLLNPGCEVNLTGTNMGPEDLTRLHTQIAHLKGPEVIPRAELPMPMCSFIEASHWVLERLSDLPPELQQRALERILTAPFDEIAAPDLQRLRRLLPVVPSALGGLHAARAQIESRIDIVEARRAEERRRTREEYCVHWDAWAQAGGSSGGKRTEAVRRMTKWFDDSQIDKILDLVHLGLTSLPEKLPPQLQTLFVPFNELDDGTAEILAANSSIRNLVMYRNIITDAGACALAKSNSITYLDLTFNYIGDAGAEALALNNTITSLDLSGKNIGTAGAQALARNDTVTHLVVDCSGDASALFKNTTITRLNLKTNCISAAGLLALKQNSTLTELIMPYSNYGNVDDEVALALGANRTITKLDLRQNKIGDVGARALAANQTITELNLWDNNIEDAGASAFATNHTVTKLNLGHNNIGDAGANGLAKNSVITKLDLSYNTIGDAGARALATNSAIKELDISHNKIGGAGAQAFATNDTLLLLDMGDNKAGDVGALAIAKNTSLAELSLIWNDIGDAGARALAANNSMTKIRLYGNRISAEEHRMLAENKKVIF